MSYGSLFRVGFFSGLVLVLLSCNGTLTPGRVQGDIVFINTSPEVAAWLGANPVSGTQWIHLYTPGQFTAAAISQYAPVNTAPDASTWIAANYDMNPDVEDSGNDFLLSVDSILFSNGATYRFGSVESAASAARLCQNITPLTTDPAGTQCDISECAALVEVTMQFTGDPADLAAIADTPIGCSASVSIEEVPGSGNFALQTTSAPGIFSLGDLTGGIATLEFPIRESSVPLELSASCSTEIVSGEDGFVLDSDGRAPFSGGATPGSAACGQALTVPVDIEIVRRAGVLRGYHDVSGYTETFAQILLDDINSSTRVDAPLFDASQLPDSQWEMEGAPEGMHTVIAATVVDNGNASIRWPSRGGPNGQVLIQTQQTTDIGATFVSKAMRLEGQVRAFDRGAQTDLPHVDSPVFTYTGTPTTSIAWRGSPDIPLVPDGASGSGGVARGRMIDFWNPLENETILSYYALLTGLSPENGDLDGSSARPTLWHLYRVTLRLDPPDSGYQSLTLYPSLDARYLFDPALASEPPQQVTDMNFCMGRITLNLQVDPALGSMYYPYAEFDPVNTLIYAPTTNGTTPLIDVDGNKRGHPEQLADAAAVASINMTLPEGMQYELEPRVNFVSAASGSDTIVYLDDMTIPSTGVLGCGNTVEPCLQLDDDQGNAAAISVAITDDTGLQTPQFCLPTGDMDLNIDVSSGGQNVSRVSYVLDPASLSPDPATGQALCESAPTGVLCTSGCGPDPAYSLNLTGLSPGQHVIQACASTAAGCTARSSYTFYLKTDTAGLTCSDDFEVTLLPGETELAASDPRITSNLSAQVSGNCGLSGVVTDDRPSVFVEGATEVTFVSAGIGSCGTTVTVNKPSQLAFVEGTNNLAQLRVHEISDGSTAFVVPLFGVTGPVRFAYSGDGTVIGLVHESGLLRFDANNGAVLGFATFPGEDLSRGGIWFDPSDASRYVVVSEPATDTMRLRLYQNEVEIDSLDFSIDSATTSRVEFAWRSDGIELWGGSLIGIPGGYLIMGYYVSVSATGLGSLLQYPEPRYTVPREEIEEVLGFTGGGLIVTNQGTTRIGLTSDWISHIDSDDIDINPDGSAALLVQGSQLIMSTDPQSPTDVGLINGPVLSAGKPKVAINNDGSVGAVVSPIPGGDPTPNMIRIYGLPGFAEPPVEIPVEFVGGMTFRPD